MANKMLIDASHPEETRVVVVKGNRIEEFDFESEHKKQIRGNIYLARVTRVEPSLQAAFVEYGGNRHGFLAFSEIHPDYYQIPFADRQALLEAEASEHDHDDDEDFSHNEESKHADSRNKRGEDHDEHASSDGQSIHSSEADSDEDGQPSETSDLESDDEKTTLMEMAVEEDAISEAVETGEEQPVVKSFHRDRKRRSRKPQTRDADEGEVDESHAYEGHADDGHIEEQEVIESVGAEDAMEEVPMRKRVTRKQYKIQEVIKRRQVLLVQVVKEERGNKGAALTTYLSLAGRYSVLMPNTGRGGGISRKITSIQDRKRLKDVVKELDVPQGMGVILRTAGANRTKVDIKRDYEYLMRAWETVRNLTLQSSAPALVYEEGSLIKRSIRDLYNKDISEIVVSGETGYREAKDFMRMLMPSHAKMVQPYRELTPMFAKAGIEAQLDRMLHPQVTLKSGGYIIINQTEALVSIDVNSGRSTREYSIENTALQTNLEAAEEVARQLRLRDLAGLVVIDFIDMEENRNNRAVEKRLKDHLKNDRARIQVGRISHFGLLEMSRQRIRASVLESTMQVCAHCNGTGSIRSQSSVGLHVIRAIEEYLQRSSTNDLVVKTSMATALYMLNHKRDSLSDLELRFGLKIAIEADEKLGVQLIQIDKGPIATGTPREPQAPAYIMTPEDEADNAVFDVEELDKDLDSENEVNAETSKDSARPHASSHADGEHRKKRRRRRRGRHRDDEQRDGKSSGVQDGEGALEDGEVDADSVIAGAGDSPAQTAVESDQDRKKRRRGRRGGRRNREDGADNAEAMEAGELEPMTLNVVEADAIVVEEVKAEDALAEQPVKTAKPRGRKPKAKAVVEENTVTQSDLAMPESVEPVALVAEAPSVSEGELKSAKKPRAPRKSVKVAAAVESSEVISTAVVAAIDEPNEESVAASPETETDESKPRKGGWWQRKGFF